MRAASAARASPLAAPLWRGGGERRRGRDPQRLGRGRSAARRVRGALCRRLRRSFRGGGVELDDRRLPCPPRMGRGPGDKVIVPSLTFIATVNVIRHVGATPVFAEIDPATYNIDPDDVARKITARTRVLMPVDQIGLPCDIEAVNALAERHGFGCSTMPPAHLPAATTAVRSARSPRSPSSACTRARSSPPARAA